MNTAKSSNGPLASGDDPFFSAYDRDQPAYGLQPSAELAALLQQCSPRGQALDLGAGAGRDSLALAAAGLEVTAVDLSQRGLDRIVERAAMAGTAARVQTVASDVRDFSLEPGRYGVIVATTVLDHIPATDAAALWRRLVEGLAPDGLLYVEVHTTDDPGSDQGAGAQSEAPVSETADQVINYFPPGELIRWAATDPLLRVLRYEERLEWDYTHGPEHQHGKAVLVAVQGMILPDWYGHPALFPRQPQ